MDKPTSTKRKECVVCKKKFLSKADLSSHCTAEKHFLPLKRLHAIAGAPRTPLADLPCSALRPLSGKDTGALSEFSAFVAPSMLGGGSRGSSQLIVVQDTRTVKQERNLRIALAVDTSGSMAGKKAEAMRRAVEDLVKSLHDKARVSITAFSQSTKEIVAAMPKRELEAQLSSKLAELETKGQTAMRDAVVTNLKELRKDQKGAQKELVVVTDGADTCSTTTHEELLALLPRPGVANVHIIFIGVALKDKEQEVLDAYHKAAPGHVSVLASSDSADAIKESFHTVTRQIRERVVFFASVSKRD